MTPGPLELAPGAGGDGRLSVDFGDLAEALPMGLVIHRHGTLLYANREAARVLRVDGPGELVGAELLDFLPDEVRDRVAEEIRRVQEDRETVELSVYPVTPGRGDATLHAEAMALPVEYRGEPAVQVMFRDVTGRVEAERALAASRDRQRLLLDQMPAVFWTTDRDLRFTSSRGAGLEALDLASGEVVGRDLFEYFDTDDPDFPPIRRHLEALDGASGNYEAEWRGRTFHCHVEPMISAGETVGVVGIAFDVTRERRLRDELEERERRFRQLVEATNVVPWELRVSDWTFTYVAPQAEDVFGYDRDAWYEPGFWPEHLHPEDRERAVRFCERQAERRRDHELEYRLVHADGHAVWVRDIVSVVPVDGGPDLLRGVMIDVSERKRIEQELERKALHDEGTGLANRTLFWDRLEHAIARARREDEALAVVFVDLDRFKAVNDSLGHAAGDRVLVEVARRLQAEFRDEDTVARFGGDEFTVLLEGVDGERPVRRAARRFLRRLDDTFRVDGEALHVTASVGIAVGRPAGDDRPVEAAREELVRQADAAMFRAKNRARVSVHVFDPEEDRKEIGHLARERELREAIERDQFTCRYQPILHLESGRVTGVEPLARWEHPERGRVPPAEFVPLAEDTGLVVPMDERLLEIACEALAGWDAAAPGDGRDLTMYKNVSAHQFEDPALKGHVRRVLARAGLAPRRLRLEVTERIVMRASDRVDELTALGVGVAVDDFGTGYSSLGYLKDLDVEALKIDMSFVHGLGESAEDEAIVRTIVTLGEALDLEVVAEGIETDEQLRVLRACGCRLGQGFHLARPMGREGFGEFLRSRAASAG